MKNLIEKLFKENSIKGKIMKKINSQSLSEADYDMSEPSHYVEK